MKFFRLHTAICLGILLNFKFSYASFNEPFKLDYSIAYNENNHQNIKDEIDGDTNHNNEDEKIANTNDIKHNPASALNLNSLHLMDIDNYVSNIQHIDKVQKGVEYPPRQVVPFSPINGQYNQVFSFEHNKKYKPNNNKFTSTSINNRNDNDDSKLWAKYQSQQRKLSNHITRFGQQQLQSPANDLNKYLMETQPRRPSSLSDLYANNNNNNQIGIQKYPSSDSLEQINIQKSKQKWTVARVQPLSTSYINQKLISHITQPQQQQPQQNNQYLGNELPPTSSNQIEAKADAHQADNHLMKVETELKSNNDNWRPLGLDMCGYQRQAGTSREPKIVGGNSTADGEFPWAVSIQRNGNHHCGGVIVGKRWILTAAHCVRNQFVGSLIVKTGGSEVTSNDINGGGNSINSRIDIGNELTQETQTAQEPKSQVNYSVDKIVIHDDFSKQIAASSIPLQQQSSQQHQSNNINNSISDLLNAKQYQHQAKQSSAPANVNNADIALIRLKNEISFNQYAWPVCFPSKESGSFSGTNAVVVGWGKLNEKSDEFSSDLQKVQLTIIDNSLCQAWFKLAGREMHIDDRIICAGYRIGGKDACHGDSGGPLLARAASGQQVVVGVVSTGIGCARPLLPGLYSRVSSYVNWIENYVSL